SQIHRRCASTRSQAEQSATRACWRRPKTSVFVCATRADFDALSEAAMANDRIGLRLFLTSGRVWQIPAGKRCLILDTGFTWTKVRILEGNPAPRTGIVPFEHVYT